MHRQPEGGPINFVDNGRIAMKVSSFTIRLLLAFLVLASCKDYARAQNVVFSASANASKIGDADQLQVTYTIQDANGLQSLTPNFKDFRVLAGPFQSQSSNVEIVGNRMVQSSSISVTFILQPRHTGSVTIPPAVAKDASGRSYQSNVIPVEIVSGSLVRQQRQQARSPFDDPFGGGDPFAGLRQPGRLPPPQPTKRPPAQVQQVNIGKDIFIKVDVDKRAVRMGEQVTALYKLYARIPMQVSISKLPSLNGFWTQDFDLPKQPKPVEEIVDGKRYQMFVLKKSALFPQQSGSLILDPAEAEGTARIMTRTQGNNPFDDPFFKQAFGGSLMMSDPLFADPFGDVSYQNVPVHLKSSPVTISVTDLPANGKPEGFTGAVGSFGLSSKIAKTQLSTDDVTTLTLTVKGSGNLKLFDAPKLNLPTGLDSYDPNILDTITGRSTTISGEKVITYTIAPRKSGNYTIPSITFSWFDPKSGSYKTASTPSYQLQVSAGKGIAAAAKGRAGQGDIVDVLTPKAAHPLILSTGYWAMYSLPLIAFIGLVVYRRRKDEEEAHADVYRTRKAGNVAQKRLATAEMMLQKGASKSFYDELSKAIWLYLSDKLGIPISALGKATAAQAMAQRGVPENVRLQVEQVLSECELALYAPMGGSQQMQHNFNEATAAINSLERTLRTS
jgi:hypothetical protein